MLPSTVGVQGLSAPANYSVKSHARPLLLFSRIYILVLRMMLICRINNSFHGGLTAFSNNSISFISPRNLLYVVLFSAPFCSVFARVFLLLHWIDSTDLLKRLSCDKTQRCCYTTVTVKNKANNNVEKGL